MKTITLILALQTTDYCPTVESCALIEQQTIVMQSRTGRAEVHQLEVDPEMYFPHFSSKDIAAWRKAGEEIAGDLLEYNDRATVAHEAKHVIHGKSHNQ